MAPKFDLIGFEREAIRRRGFIEFVRRAWPHVEPGKPYSERWYHRVQAARCQAASEADGGPARLFGFNMPPATLKSTIGSVLWPAWHWGTIDASHGILGASYDHRLALRDSRKMLELVQSQWYRDIFPHVKVPDVAGVTEYSNDRGGFRLTASLGGKITGRHPRIRIIDDPTKPIRVSAEALEQTNAWHGNTWASRADEPTKVIDCLIMQRLAPNDLSSHLAKLGYDITVFGAEYRAALECKYDERTIEGEILDAERMPARLLDQLKITMGEDFEIQYNQNAQDKRGQIFDRANIRLVDALPNLSEVQASCISVDCTFKGTADSDYIAIHVWLLAGGVFYLADCIEEKADFVDTIDLLRSIIARWPGVYLKLIEDKANGPAVISVLKRKVPGIEAVTPLGGKIDRANAIAPLVRTKSVAILAGQPWTERVLYQVGNFPRVPNDDHVDAMSQALAYMMLHGFGHQGESDYGPGFINSLRSMYG